MTRKEYERAGRLADEIIQGLRRQDLMAPGLGTLMNAAVRLKKMLAPPLTLAEIVAKVPAENHTARARAIGLSRQGYYNLLEGTARRSPMTAKRLAELTGVPEETIREVW